MRITVSLPDALAGRFLSAVPSRRRSATVARLLEEELARRAKGLEQACLAANADQALNAEILEWQAFDDAPSRKRRRRS
jgi:metal-responsive CopG/Arc/MetJ family transcriptional regulator